MQISKTVDITPLFKQAGIDVPSLSIIETPGMYPYKEKVEDNWAYYTAVGCKRLKEIFASEGKTIRNIGIIGICSGVEGIAIVQIFRSELRRLIVTDVDDEILEGTIKNIGRDSPSSLELIPLVGSFCEPIEEAGYHVDFVHGNIPNLPSTGKEDLTRGAEKGTFLPSSLYEGYEPPKKFVRWAMSAQFAYLQSAEKILKAGDSVITELGGRMPLSLVKELFDETGYELQEIIVGFKEQTEALIDFEGYHRLEQECDVTFEFYLFNESQKILKEHHSINPSHDMTGEQVKNWLAPYKISAGQALECYHQGIPVGHMVHLFRGIKK